jgi:sugar O-acyltransferase (sialic acid O-acetyltransferase NeuD family)
MTDAEHYSLVILGAGGHAKVLIEALRAQGNSDALAALDNNQELWGRKVQGVPVLGGDDLLPGLVESGLGRFAIGLGGVKDNRPRKQLFERALDLGLEPVTVIHPSAIISPSAELGPGCQVLPGAVINADAKLGANVIINTRAVVEHDCRLGSHVHVASGAVLCSGCSLGEGVHIGAGAVVRQLLSIGEWCVVGAGAAVTKTVDKGKMVQGVPAKPARNSSVAQP